MRAMKTFGLVLGLGAMIALFAMPRTVQAQDATATQQAPAAQQPAPAGGDQPAAASPAGSTGAASSVGEALPTEEQVADQVKKESLPPLGFLVEWFQQGGMFMYPLLLCSVLGLAVVIERMWTLGRAHQDVTKLMSQVVGGIKADGVQGGIEVCQRTRGPVAAVLHAGLMRAGQGPEAVEKAIEAAGTVEMSFLQKGLVALATLVNVAPLLGFLGTVSGMIHAFEAIAAAEQVSAKLVATGISEALITTEAGLCIAIPLQSAMNYFISRIDRFVLEMEEASIEVVDTLSGIDVNTKPGR
jgi:biopolymer transport protein ExbB